jgi:two-component system, OmpR family, copper resistance phosphate regulon response regulator CusR
MKVLLVEDDAELTEILRQGFAEHGIRITSASNVDEGRLRVALGSYDVIILDVLLPGGDGFTLCDDIRRRKIATPILMLTALDALNDRVRGLDAGADDYVVKPFAFKELLARVRAVARRPPAIAATRITVADLEVDIAAQRVTRAGARIDLTAKEFALLEFFALHRDQVVDRAAITAHVWDDNHDPFTNVLEVLILRLRRKIDDGFEPKLIHTLRGAGYRFGV